MRKIEEILYADPQQQRPCGYCRRCGGLVYPPSMTCVRCERRHP